MWIGLDGHDVGCLRRNRGKHASTAQGVANVAAAGLSGTPRIETFVIGVGSSLTSLNGIAQAGGSTQAFIVDTGQDVNAQFLDALNKIRGQVQVPCEYQIPTNTDATQQADITKINVTYTPGGGAPTDVFFVSGADQCDPATPTWYFDNPAAPTKIKLCASACNPVTADKRALVSVVVGCAQKVLMIR